jgi:DNA repair protein RecN (Recombination protein N)
MDRVDMLLAPNPGEPPMPLGRIASGGELSRIMLALKTVFAGNDQTPVVIFDEIDSGIGGEAGMIMGSRLRQLAQFHQVCCITHLPQIASQAHAQFVVEKTSTENRTLTQVQEVTGANGKSRLPECWEGVPLRQLSEKPRVKCWSEEVRSDASARLNKPKRKPAKT